MQWRGRSLRFQLSVAIIGVVVTSVLFVAVGAYLFVAWGEYRFLSSLSPAAREAYARTWADTGMPPPQIVEEISIAEETILLPVYLAELQVVAVLSVITIVVGSFVSLGLARRLTAPLEAAAISARTIAQGEFSHRPKTPGGGSPREVASLAASFTELAESLERMEENLQLTSASIAHEIRTPLTVVQGYLQGIRDGVFEANDEQLDRMLHRLEALGRLIDDLKTLSLAHAGRLRLEVSPTRLRDRLRELVAWMQKGPGGERIELEEPDVREEEAIVVDAARIEQVVLVLLHNALRYGGDGRVAVHFRQDDREAVVEVTDEGSGFSTEALQRAGERFWRGEVSRSRETGGSGLGLAVAKAIVEAHGGRLDLSNRTEGGAAVAIHLPR